MSSRFGSSGGGSSRFELPALNLNFGSITDGTDIPPPPESPVQKVPTPPQTPPPTKEVGQGVTAGHDDEENKKTKEDETASQESKPAPVNGNIAGTKRSADDDAPLSPAASSRQGSIRRLLSRTMLNNSYAEGQLSPSAGSIATTTTHTNGARPVSQSGGSFMDERKSKRRSGWFQRLRSGDMQSKRSTMLFDGSASPIPSSPTTTSPPGSVPAPAPRKASGPPPPMIPELTGAGSLGDDLFSNIK